MIKYLLIFIIFLFNTNSSWSNDMQKTCETLNQKIFIQNYFLIEQFNESAENFQELNEQTEITDKWASRLADLITIYNFYCK